MAFELAMRTVGTQVAGADLTAETNQLRFVKLNSSGAVVLASVAGEKVFGVLYGKAGVGDVCDVVVDAGAVMVKAGATVAAGAFVMTDATGRAITAATTGSTIVGQALEGGAVGETITIRLATFGVV